MKNLEKYLSVLDEKVDGLLLTSRYSRYYGAEYEGRAIHTDTWICIDTGAAGGKSPMLLCLDTMQEYYY